MDLLCGKDMLADRGHDRIEQPGRLSNPVAQCRAIEFEPLAGIHLALAIERQMIAIFRHQQMRQRGRCGTAAWRRHRWRRSLRDGVARIAGKLRPHVTNDLEVPRHVIQHLGDVLPQPGHAATTVAADAGAIVRRQMHDLLAWEMLGERLTLRPVGGRRGWCRGIKRLGAGGIFGRTGLQFLELELELLDLAADPLRRSAELHATQLRDLEPQLLDLQRLQLYCGLSCLQLALAGQRERTQCGGIGRQFGRGERHVSIYQDPARPTRIEKESVLCHTSIGCGVGDGAMVRRQSIASISTENCAGVSVIAPSMIGGQTKRPLSRRLAISHIPLPSQYRPLK